MTSLDEERLSRLGMVTSEMTIYTADTNSFPVFGLERSLLDAGFVVRHLRGDKMRTELSLYDEVAAAFQFPAYFGENSAALDECLSDLDWLPASRGYVVIITRPAEMLRENEPSALSWFVRRLEYATREWAHTSELGPRSDRPSQPFKVVLSADDASDAELVRWKNAGAFMASL